MKHTLYSHIKTLRGEHHFEKIMSARDSGLPMNHKYVDMYSHTPHVEKYEPLIKTLSQVYGVVVLYNRFSWSDGIWVVGNGALVSLFSKTLENIVIKIEKITREVRSNHYTKNLTLDKAKMQDREGSIIIYLGRLNSLKLKLFQKSGSLSDFIEKATEYINQTSSLITKHHLKW